MLPLEVATYLAAAGLGLQLGVSIFDVPVPEDAQEAAVWIESYPGREDDRTFGPSLQASLGEWVGFSVFVRDGRENAGAAETLSNNIFKKLRNLGPLQLSGVMYRDVRATGGPPYYLGADASNRPVYAGHYEADKDES